MTRLQTLGAETKEHLLGVIVPFWMSKRDPDFGGFYGFMDYNLAIDKQAVKGCILNSRITWFFSNVYALYKDGFITDEDCAAHGYAIVDIKECAQAGFDFMRTKCIDNLNGGIYWSVTYDGKPSDTTKHTYNQAFAIYALSSYYGAFGEDGALNLAKRLYDVIESKCTDEIGYLEAFTRDFGPESNEKLSENGVMAAKTMNTLLHVFEAYTELYRVSKFEPAKTRIGWILDTIAGRIYNPALHRQDVFFDANYKSIIDLHSYGHDIETAWLIDRGLEVLDDEIFTMKMSAITRNLIANVFKLAFDGHSLANECENGVVNEDRIWWVQAECVVGLLNAFQKQSFRKDYFNAVLSEWEFIKEHVYDKREGSEWFWKVDKEGNPLEEKPIIEEWKCPYHNGRMCMEVIRRVAVMEKDDQYLLNDEKGQAEEPAAEAAVAEEAEVPAEDAAVAEAAVEETVAEETAAEEAVAEEAVTEEAVAEEPAAEESLEEAVTAEIETPVEETVSVEAEVPAEEAAVAEEPAVEEPAVEEPAVEEPVVEEPAVEEAVAEESSVEEPVVEETDWDALAETPRVHPKYNKLLGEQELFIRTKNEKAPFYNGIYDRYVNPVLTRKHIPLFWQYDVNEVTNPYFMERLGINAVMNSGAIYLNGKYYLIARIEGNDRKSFFGVAESTTGIDGFRFWDYPILLDDLYPDETNVYDMRLTQHEDGYIYGVFCSESKDTTTNDLSAAVAAAGIVRTKDLKTWERLDNLKTLRSPQQRNVVLHPEFVDGKYAFYTRPMDDFIETGSGGGIGFGLCDDIEHAVIDEEKMTSLRKYHTITEAKNGAGATPIKTSRGWIHIAHGVRNTAAGLRYVIYAFATALDDPSRVIAEPSGLLIGPRGSERVGDVSNVTFTNGCIVNDEDEVFIYYASSDTRVHVATTTIDKLLDYVFETPEDPGRSVLCVQQRCDLISKNLKLLRSTPD